MTAPILLRGHLARPRLLGRGGAARPPRARELTDVPLGHPGTCADDPTLTIIISDDSGSVTSGNDPIGNRYLEAGYALDKLGRRCRCGRDLAAIVHFDVPTAADVPPTPITRRFRSTIQAGLRTPSEAVSSNLGPSLHIAHRLASEHPGHLTTLVVASDFELLDSDADRVLAQLAAFPGKVHAIVLRAMPPTQLTDDPRITVTRVDHDSAIGAVAAAVFDGLTVHRPNRRLASTSVTERR